MLLNGRWALHLHGSLLHPRQGAGSAPRRGNPGANAASAHAHLIAPAHAVCCAAPANAPFPALPGLAASAQAHHLDAETARFDASALQLREENAHIVGRLEALHLDTATAPAAPAAAAGGSRVRCCGCTLSVALCLSLACGYHPSSLPLNPPTLLFAQALGRSKSVKDHPAVAELVAAKESNEAALCALDAKQRRLLNRLYSLDNKVPCAIG